MAIYDDDMDLANQWWLQLMCRIGLDLLDMVKVRRSDHECVDDDNSSHVIYRPLHQVRARGRGERSRGESCTRRAARDETSGMGVGVGTGAGCSHRACRRRDEVSWM